MSRELSESDREALNGIEFPSHLPEDDCILAILEVREYILENGMGTKEEMWSDIVLDTTSYSAGREVCRHWGYVPKFRDKWWEYVILSGLRCFSDVEPVNDEELGWRPRNGTDNS